jgi:alpha-tubulin suppressor-like RCC1 family protein
MRAFGVVVREMIVSAIWSSLMASRLVGSELVGWGGDVDRELQVPGNATNVVAVYAGGFHGVALRADGTVVVWGNLPKDGGTYPGEALQPPSDLSNVVSVAAGDHFNVALKSDGRVVGWGDNSFGQLKNLSRLSNIVAVAAGDSHFLALGADGTVKGVGGNYDGQLNFPLDLADAVSVAAEDEVSLVLRSDGTVIEAGRALAPVPPEARGVVAAAVGQYHALALRRDGGVIEWGYRRNDAVPRPADLGIVVRIAAGAHHDLALRSDGRVEAWGANWLGQAVVPNSVSNVVGISAGYFFSLALVGEGAPQIIQHPLGFAPFVGGNARLVVNASGTVPLRYQWRKHGHALAGATNAVLALDGVRLADAGEYDAIVRNTFGVSTSQVATISVGVQPPMHLTIEVAPTNRIGFLGGKAVLSAHAQGTPPLRYSWFVDSQPIDHADQQDLRLDHLRFTDAADYSVAVANSVGSLTSAPVHLSVVNLAVWGGRNVGSDDRVFDPPATLSNAVAVSASQWHVLVRRHDGGVAGWGDPYGGKLPVPASATNLVSVAAGGEFSLGLRRDGTVLVWGDQVNHYGIGNLPQGLTNVVQLEAAYSWALALKADGTAVQWGTYIGGSMKPPPPGLSNVVQISAGARHALALLDDGTVVGWGSDDCDQATPPEGLNDVVAVAAGNCYSMALREDGTVVEWGRDTFSPPPEATNLVAIATGNFHRVGLLEDGRVFSWGIENGGAGQTRVPADLPPVFAITAAGDASFGVIPATSEPHIARQPKRRTLFRNQLLSLDTKLFPGSSHVFFQWFKDGVELAGKTARVLRRSSAQPADSGFYYVMARNAFGADTSRAVEVRVVNRPPVARGEVEPSFVLPTTQGTRFVIAPGRGGATVLFDGSSSADADNDPLEYSWLEQGESQPFGTGVTTSKVLALGRHTIVLMVSDGLDHDSDQLVLDVITPAQGVEELLVPFVESEIDVNSRQSLIAILNGATAALVSGDLGAAVDRLEAFEKKLRKQITPANPAAADALANAVLQIVEAIRRPKLSGP